MSSISSLSNDLNKPSNVSPFDLERTRGRKVETGKLEEAGNVSFKDMLVDVSNKESAADKAVQDYTNGKSQNIHESMLAMQKADLSFKLLVSVRNKVLDAYREVMRMS